MRAFAVAALVLVAVSAIQYWEMEPLEKLDPINFTITNCGDPNSDYVVIKKLDITSPMPIKEGDYITGSYDVQVVNDLQKISASLVIEKQMTASSWVKIPCLGKVGSCTYDDACSYMTEIPNQYCQKFIGQDCQCPIKANEVKEDNFKYGPVPSIPSMAKGNFRITVNAMETTTQKRACCYVVTLSID